MVDPKHLTGWHPVVIDEDTDNHGKTFRQWIVRDDTNTEVCKVFYVTEDGEAQARLIGAAPALLSELKRLVAAAENNPRDLAGAITAALFTIRQAEGRHEVQA
jgi:hypothetical protein